MERVKLTLEEFNYITNIMKKMCNDAQIRFSENRNRIDFSEEEFMKDLIKEYTKLQNELLSYDLSEIPFESWNDLIIDTGDMSQIDFSNTHANIDFEMLRINQKGNFKGCNIRNVDKFWWPDDKCFDYEVVESNQDVFLSNIFSPFFKEKYYNKSLTADDMVSMSSAQIRELEEKLNFQNHLNIDYVLKLFINGIGLSKSIEFYNKYYLDYKYIEKLYFDDKINLYIVMIAISGKLNELLKKCDISEIKNVINNYIKNDIIHNEYINLFNFSDTFVKNNEDLFLMDVSMDDNLRKKYYSKNLSMNDVVNNIDLFKNIKIYNFMDDGPSREFVSVIGIENLNEVFGKHKLVYEHLLKVDPSFSNLKRYYDKNKEFSVAFPEMVKRYILKEYKISNYTNEKKPISKNYTKNKYNVDSSNKKNITYSVPYFLKSLDLKIVDSFSSIYDIRYYDEKTILLDDYQRAVIESFGVENILRFDKETDFFSHDKHLEDKIPNIYSLGLYIVKYLKNDVPTFNSYEEFTDYLAICFDNMRINGFFLDFPNYDFIEGEFRDKYKYIFIDKNADEKLKDIFYFNKITPEVLRCNELLIPYLLDKNLKNIVKGDFNINVFNFPSEVEEELFNSSQINFITYYSYKYGNFELLKLLSKYGHLCDNLKDGVFDLSSKETIERDFRKIIYRGILSDNKCIYGFLSTDEKFAGEYPDIFIDYNDIPIEDDNEKLDIYTRFYSRKIYFSDIYKYPQLVDFFENKNLKLIFGQYIEKRTKLLSYNEKSKYTEIALIESIGNKKFLELCSRYGRYLEKISDYVNIFNHNLSFENLCLLIEDAITSNCKNGRIRYLLDDAPSFLKEGSPELFLSEDAPEKLKNVFYYNGRGEYLNFLLLKDNMEWISYLKNKSIKTAFMRKDPLDVQLSLYFDLFGEDTAVKLGIVKTETVNEMIVSRQVELMKKWYDETGQKFIPDYVVMQNFDLKEASKFLMSTSNWGRLMKIKSFSEIPEGRDALLKLAYSFGVFDNDIIGIKKLEELLTHIPRHLSKEDYYDLLSLEDMIFEYEKKLKEESNPEDITMPIGIFEYENLRKELMNNLYNISENDRFFNKIFHVNDDGTASLTMNPQSHVKAMSYLRKILEIKNIVLDFSTAHRLFSGFELKYDKDFREFLLNNLDEIRNKNEYSSYIASIQKQFDKIKAFNSNRHLTLDLAVSFVQANKYENVNIGNEKVAEISAVAGYTQRQFETLQKIYNYGRQRVFSSIPRIEKVSDKYIYQMLRLDDPLAMAIGTLTNCCQELGNAAEVCMEHSMVDQNGRVFVIKDFNGNIIAQSWVWRNKDVLCFDNIEIPDRVFMRARRENDINSEKLADEIFEIYKKAAASLIEEDEIVLKKLLEEGKITSEEYNGLRLGKVTVGIGYNDIASSIKKNAKIDEKNITRPLPFNEPIKLQRGLYTNDSVSQYILEERMDRSQYRGKTLPVHSDNFIIYTNENFKEKDLLILQRLEVITKGQIYGLNTLLSDYDDKSKIIYSIASNCGLDVDNTKIIMNPNFAIIYDDTDDKIRIGDLFYNTMIDNGDQKFDISSSVIAQISLALKQISKDKIIDISMLNNNQKEMYEKATNCDDKIDELKGIGYIR